MGSKINISDKLRLFLIDIDTIYPMQSSEFGKSLYFGNNFKKLQQNEKDIFFYLKIDFYR